MDLLNDRGSKEPFLAEAGFADRVGRLAFDQGLVLFGMQGCVNTILGDELLIIPPLVITRPQIDYLNSDSGRLFDSGGKGGPVRNREKSRALMERARAVMAGGVGSGGRAALKPYPLYFDHGMGSRLYDVDGNEYIDYVLGLGPLILGHTPPAVISFVKTQLERGQIYAAQHELEVLLSEKLVQLIPCADMVNYNNTGSEGLQVALRLARAYTGRQKVIKFEGHYHGWMDNIYVSCHPPLTQAGPADAPHGVLSHGQVTSILNDLIILPWNNLDVIEATLEHQSGEIAAIITEPIVTSGGVILPRPGYLEGLRDLCTRSGVVLVFDEVVTGFRVSLGGAQEYLGIIPDLAVFGKALGGGFPISCIAGRGDIMDLIARREVVHAGTYNSNPISIAAAYATVAELEKDGGKVYDHLFTLGRQLMDGLEHLFRELRLPVLIQGPGPMFYVYFTDQEQVMDYRTYLQADAEAYARFSVALQERGVFTQTGRGLWYLSAAHTQDDVMLTLQAAAEALELSQVDRQRVAARPH
ncbi:MAG: aminotransferase class III-fold pyridoxal phosphate-dependent enzyme [Chloroflexi bacterium]|nr:aminotransferase class III-fold pyridoxal phosphate-dependent enzyme [Chloroflexota bacterium]